MNLYKPVSFLLIKSFSQPGVRGSKRNVSHKRFSQGICVCQQNPWSIWHITNSIMSTHLFLPLGWTPLSRKSVSQVAVESKIKPTTLPWYTILITANSPGKWEKLWGRRNEVHRLPSFPKGSIVRSKETPASPYTHRQFAHTACSAVVILSFTNQIPFLESCFLF